MIDRKDRRTQLITGAIVVVIILILAVIFGLLPNTVGATIVPEFPKTICHTNPSQSVTLTFQNQQSYNGHLGTPHSNSTFDTNGACKEEVVLKPKVRLTSMCQINEKEGKMRFREENGGTMTIAWSAKTAGGFTFTSGTIQGGQTIYFNAPAGKTIIVDWNCTSGCKGEGKETKAQNTVKCEEEPTPTPTPEVTPVPETPVVTTSSSSVTTPVCTDGSTSKLVANLHVWRNGSSADVNFFLTEGDHANIYWKVNDSNDWQHAVSDVRASSDNFVSYTINDLDPNLGYTFGVQQTIGCGGGEIATSVVIDPPANGKLFNFSYWTW